MALKGRTGRATLSDRLRGMRFMREREDADLKAKEAKEAKEREAAARWVIDDPSMHDLSTVVILDDGEPDPPVAARQSFGKFNVAVERRMRAGDASDDDDPVTSAKQEAAVKTEDPDFVPVKNEEVEEIVDDSPPRQSATGAHTRDASSFRGYRSNARRESLGSAPRRGKRSYSGSSTFNSRKKFKAAGGNNRPLFRR